MRLKFLVTDKPYTIKEALSKELLREHDWFEHMGDLYLLIWQGEDTVSGIKVKRDGIKEEDVRGNYKLFSYEDIENMDEMYELNEEDRFATYYFSIEDKVRLVWVK